MTKDQVASIQSPPDCVPIGPVQSVPQTLPFGELTWENFERLCHRLASLGAEVEQCSRYGRAGQAQQGIDIFARKKNGKYDCWQAKRYKQYSVNNLQSAISTFLKGDWLSKTETFFIAVQASLADTNIQDEIEAQTAKLKAQGLVLVVLSGDELSDRLRDHPRLVLDFFGRAWTKALFGDAIDKNILDCLDGAEIAQIRKQLACIYHTQFQLLDRGAIDNSDSSNGCHIHQEHALLSRFTRPDILIKEKRDTTVISEKPNSTDISGKPQNNLVEAELAQHTKILIERDRRIPFSSWLTQSNQLALLGDAGTGKSTVLRCIALDLSTDQLCIPEIASRWGSLIPIYISFAKWTNCTASNGGIVGLKEVVSRSLQPLLTTPNLVGFLDRAIDEHRILLLVDGLDEWSSEQAARTTLQTLFTFVGTHQIPTIITGRPRGLAKVGAIPHNWSIGRLAPLSNAQQRLLVLRCLGQVIPEQNLDIAIDPSYTQIADRFFRELKREAGLIALAETPLLLVSLLMLARRRITLPKRRAQALEQLIDILLEIHPQSRATAAGDIKARFNAVQDIEVRKGAIAALAYAFRQEGGDAGYPVSQAKIKIRDYLASSDTHAFTTEKANEAANEILAVNAETVGLLIEKGPSEIGFVHASLEEYLTATHIQKWPLEEINAFIKNNSTQPRWRNVISNLISITPRPTEIDQFVEAIQSTETDTFGELAKCLLLTDIAFSTSKMSPTNAKRLGQQCITWIEHPKTIKEREAFLSSALNGTHHSILGPILLEKIQSWAPKNVSFTEQLFEVLGTWEAAPDLLYTLQRGLCDQTQGEYHAAAKAIAKVYRGNDEVQDYLINLLNGKTAPHTTVAVIEALVLGWPTTEGIEKIISDALESLHTSLQAVAIWALVKLGKQEETQLDQALELLQQIVGVHYLDRPLVLEALVTAWTDHPRAIERCLASVKRYGRIENSLDLDIGTKFLLGCSTDNLDIRKWIVDELQQDYPFSMHNNWDCLIPFAQVDSTIKEALICAATKPDKHLDYRISGIIAAIKDERLKRFAINSALNAQARWSRYWYILPLLDGWLFDQEVMDFLNEVRAWPDDEFRDSIPLLPKLFPDHDECKNLLLRLLKSETRHRQYAYPAAFAAIGCDSSDEEVVEALVDSAKFDIRFAENSGPLIHHFGKNPIVIKFARELLLRRNQPLATIAATYPLDPDFRNEILRRLNSLPVSLRYTLAEVASIDSDYHPTMAALLKHYDWEVDCDLKVLLSTRYYEFILSSQIDRTEAVETLLSDVQSVGHDHDERSAAAFAGLLILDAVDDFTNLRWGDKPLSICIGRYDQESSSLLELIARKWEKLRLALGDGLLERIGNLSSLSRVWDSLAPYLSWNNQLRQEFIRYCEQNDNSLGITSLIALSRERPQSDLVKHHCLRIINNLSSSHMRSPWNATALSFEAAKILHNQFPADAEITELFHNLFTTQKETTCAMLLAIYDAKNTVFKTLKASPLQIGVEGQQWGAACTISANTQDSKEFIEVLRAMINRDTHHIWNFQEHANSAVLERLARDPKAVELLEVTLIEQLTHSEAASLPRYLAAIKPFDETTFTILRKKLDLYSRKKGVVITGYDALSNEIRPVAYSLLDALR